MERSGGCTMHEPASLTHRLAMTHGLSHSAKRRCRNRLMQVRESVSLNLHPMRREKENHVCVREGACVHAGARVCGRACARVCVRGLKQTHETHRLTPSPAASVAPVRTPLAHVASFAARWPTIPSAPPAGDGSCGVAQSLIVPGARPVGHRLRPFGLRGVRCPGLAKDPLSAVGRPERDGRRLGAGIGEQNSTRCKSVPGGVAGCDLEVFVLEVIVCRLRFI